MMMSIKSLFERKYIEVSVPGRCIHVLKRIPKKQEALVKRKLAEAQRTSDNDAHVRVIVKNIFGNVVRYE